MLLVSILSRKYQSQLTNPLFFLNARMTSSRQSKKAMHAVKIDTQRAGLLLDLAHSMPSLVYQRATHYLFLFFLPRHIHSEMKKLSKKDSLYLKFGPKELREL